MATRSSPRPASSESRPAQGFADILYASGVQHLKTRRIPEAMEAFHAALGANPAPEQQAAILHALGDAARRLGRDGSAESFYGQALSLEPGRREMLADLSNLYRSNGRYRDAQILLEEALDADPAAPELWLSLANVLREIGDLERARGFIAEALRLQPHHAPALGSMGDLLAELGETGAAQEFYAQALKLAPFDARLRHAYALALLSDGILAEGWHEFSHRFQASGKSAVHALPLWTGRPIPGKTLVLTAEASRADQLLFASVVADAIRTAQAAQVIIECEPALAPLFARAFPDADIQPPGVTCADLALPIGDLPRLFRKRFEDFPKAAAPLSPDCAEQLRWQSALECLGPAPYIGVSWRAERLRGRRAERLAPLGAWSEFLGRCAGTFVCLQADATPEELAALEGASGPAIAWRPDLDQKRQTDRLAGLLATLDAVVSVPDESAALAAALGTPTLKLTYSGSWTGLGQDREPLAPSCRIIKPRKPGDWDDVFARAAQALTSL